MRGIVGKVEKTYTPTEKELGILQWWDLNNIYLKVKSSNHVGGKFYFLDGPPYVTNPPHVGTAWNKFLKDVIIRYHRMRGLDVRDQPGYDCHGLPIEVKVEESLGIKSKKDIEGVIGVEDFISRCKDYAMDNMKQQTTIFRDLGVWMDWDNPYLTLKDSYMESVWWIVKRAYEKDLLGKGLRVVHWCPRCETALAGYESTDEYREVSDHSIYVKMPLKEHDNEFILVWTTTPWTIPANVAVMVNPNEEYARVEVQGERYIIAKARCEQVLRELGIPYKVVGTFKGSELEGLEYIHPMKDEVPIQRSLENAHMVVLSREYVSMNEGTGCVHSAPGHGEEDFEVGLKYGLPVFSPVDETGRFTVDAGKYAGKYVKEADTEIIEDLRRKGLLLHHVKVVHSYPHCWRCKTPLIMRAADQWFIKVTSFKDKLLEENAKVNWIPRWAGSKRFADWLKGARDWVISRQRFWGVPLPIWICMECNSIKVIGSAKELIDEAPNSPTELDLHRDHVDDIKLSCKCGGIMERIPDIIDVWMDSGAASWASLNYPQEKEGFNLWWPADAITEAHDQTRGWFYTQLITGVLCLGEAPYRSVMMHGHTLDLRGQKMSKSIGNFIAPQEVVAKYGRDSLRLYELQSTVWEDFRFSMEKVEEAHRDIQVIWNAISFASLYMNLDGFTPSRWPPKDIIEHMRYEDKWLLSRTEGMKVEVTKALDNYEIHEAARLIKDFILEDLSHWYIRLVRRRFWLEKESKDKLAAYSVLFHSLRSWIPIAAPFLPFLTEITYRAIIAPTLENPSESVHMLKWPEPKLIWLDENLEQYMEIVRRVVTAAISARQTLKLKLRQPVTEIKVLSDDPDVRRAVQELKEIILEAANTKALECSDVKRERRIENLIAVPKFQAIGPIFKDKASLIAESITKLDGVELFNQFEERGVFELEMGGDEIIITPDMVSFREEMPDGFAKGEFEGGRVYVNSRLTSKLRREGLVRDVIRRIQEMRRLMDLQVEAFIDLHILSSTSEDEKALQEYKDYIREEVRAYSLNIIRKASPELEKASFNKTWIIDDRSFSIGINEVEDRTDS